MSEFEEYYKIINTNYGIIKEEINAHIEKLKALDTLMPPSSTFVTITDPKNNKYDFISKNFEIVTGHKIDDFIKKGMAHFQTMIHPDEVQIWSQILTDVMDYFMENYSPEMLDKLDFQYNYRFKGSEGKYLNILENQVYLIANSNGKPLFGMGHYTIFGEGEKLPLKATIRRMNEKNEYETVFHKVYGTNKSLGEVITKRERDILRLVSFGYTNEFIADKLSISIHTVLTHRKNMLEKTSSKNTSELVGMAIREGLI